LPDEHLHASGRVDEAADRAKHVPLTFSVTAIPMLKPAGPKGVSNFICVRVGGSAA